MAVRTLSSAPSLARTFATSVVTARLKSGSAVPDTTLRLEDVAIDRDRLLAYQRVCGFDVSDTLPATYPHVIGFPLQASLMSGRDFPLPLPGMVHLRNSITVRRALSAEDRLTVSVRAENLRPHSKGRLVDLVTEVDTEGERVWEGRSTYLSRGRGTADAPGEVQPPGFPDGPPIAVWRVPDDIGRRYAAVSGDVNPIHLHPLTAKAMGFPRAIAHGMWTYAHALSCAGRRAGGPMTSTVWFAKPVLLPSTNALVTDSSGDDLVLGLRSARDESRVHLTLVVRT